MQAQYLADLIRARVRVGPDHSCDPEELARRLGYHVEWADQSLIGSVEGMLVRGEIHVLRTGVLTRDRWTLAHELAHAEAKAHGLDWRDEGLANACAAELLLPSRLMARHIQRGLDLPAVASLCSTSLEATARRAIEIVPGLAAADYGEHARLYSSLPAHSHRLSRLVAGLASRCRSHGRAKRIRLSSWVARGWSGPDRRAGIAVILRG